MTPDVTVVIPVLNEERTLGLLLADLAAQRDIALEVLVADGGSRDGTRRVFAEAQSAQNLSLSWVPAPAGRGKQMNTAARMAQSEELLFLHSDTRLEDHRQLRTALDFLKLRREQRGSHPLAGHFALRFIDRSQNPRAYYFYEAKSRLNRPGCVNGDQGQWLSRDFFRKLGGFDETLPFMEDARLSEGVYQSGDWVCLPGRLSTSARRFEAEGVFQRQVLNALIRNFDLLGNSDFFAGALTLYREHSNAQKLRLGPFFALANRQTFAGGLIGWLQVWGGTGRYVRDNAWQLAFALDCRRNYRRGIAPGKGPTPITDHFEPVFNLFTANAGGRLVATWLTMMAFYTLWGVVAIREAMNDKGGESDP